MTCLALPLRALALMVVWAAVCQAGFREDFNEAKTKRPSAVDAVQRAYAESEADNPDYYILLADYWFTLSQKIWVRTRPPEGSKSDAGNISRRGVNDPTMAKKAPDLLAEAARRFPQRPDISIGWAFCLLKEGRPGDATNVIVNLVSAYRKAPASFIGRDEKPLDASRAGELIADVAYGYCRGFYKKDNPETSAFSQRIALAMSEAFPKDPTAFNILAALALHASEYGEAVTFLEKAHAIAPADPVITLNLADRYLADGRRSKARELANLIIKSNSESSKPYLAEAQAIVNKAER